jgi:hypothetical protein
MDYFDWPPQAAASGFARRRAMIGEVARDLLPSLDYF